MAISPKTPLISESVSALKGIPIRDNGEPLVDFLEACPLLVLDQPRFTYRRETLVRESVARMLDEATRRLPDGYKLAIVEGWRAQHIQRRMHAGIRKRLQAKHPDWSSTKLTRIANQFTAPVDRRVPPPHSTGGAVDVILIKPDGSYHDHTSPFDRYDENCYYAECPGLSDRAKETRRILRAALLPTGLTNYPSEYWHWSYGDQGWSYRGGHECAIYGPTEPPGFEPAPEDLVDEPLVLIEVR
ncbi:MAG: M15 family metallopeptidase [Fimbriimonadaceae bacterium]